MTASYVLMAAVVAFFSSWTLAYQLTLACRWPAAWSAAPFLILLAICLGLGRTEARRGWASLRRDRSYLLGVAAVALTAMLFILCLGRESADDFSFFRRALAQVGHLDQPFFIGDTAHNVPGLPALSNLHLLTSYEMLAALGGSLLRLDLFALHHNVGPALGVILMAFGYGCFYRELGVDRRRTIWAVALVFVFIVIFDWREDRSWGRYLSRLWLGKSLLWLVLIPILTLFSYRYLKAPSWRRWLLVALAVVCGFGLSGSALILVPTLIGGVGLAHLITQRFASSAWRRCAGLGSALVYWVAMAVAVLWGLVALPEDMSVWGSSAHNPGVWWENLAAAIGGPASLIRDLLLLLVLPWIVLPAPRALFLSSLTLALGFVFANPILAPKLLGWIPPNAYWRFIFLLPLPLCAGLLVNGIRPVRLAVVRPWRVPALILCASALPFAAFTDGVGFEKARAITWWKAPWDHRFPPASWSFVSQARTQLSGKSVLASADIAWLLALGIPDVRLEAARAETSHIFANIGQAEEGLRRLRAQRYLDSCGLRSRYREAFLQSLQDRVDAVVFRSCPEKDDQLRQDFGPGWIRAPVGQGWVVMVRAG